MRKSTGRRNDSDSDSSTEQSRTKSNSTDRLASVGSDDFSLSAELKRDEISHNHSGSTKKISEREREAELLKQHEEREQLKHQ